MLNALFDFDANDIVTMKALGLLIQLAPARPCMGLAA